MKSPAQVVTAQEVSAWATDAQLDFPQGIAELALNDLQQRGFVRSKTYLRSTWKADTNRWHVTPQGMHAAKAALRAMPGGPTPDMQSLPVRLWNLLRIRRRLTAAEAAETLIDAGDAGGDFAAQTKRIGALLAAWAKHAPKAVAVAHKREAGRVRYVLLTDLGRWPPPQGAGQMHPTDFAHVRDVPARYRKAAAE
ncbi:MAG: hypothetical protein QM569_14790 [Acidovorax sp.]|uniref:hypothetical protein n=1 Tax=Acidovorax sp. TaxID=1872122 RepID=UPI0039E33643